MDSSDFARALVNFFRDYLPIQRGLSKETIRKHKSGMLRFVDDFLRGHKKKDVDKFCMTELTRDLVLEWLKWLEDDGNSINTRNQRLRGMKSFAKYMHDQGRDLTLLSELQAIRRIKEKKCSDPTPVYASPEGIKLLFDQPDISTREGLRHLALLSLMYDSAARVSEITKLRLCDLHLRVAKPIINLNGKGNKNRVFAMSECNTVHLNNYIKEFNLEQKGDKDPLFVNAHGKNLTTSGVRHILLQYVDRARKIKPDLIPVGFTNHSLRHSRAMHWYEADVTLEEIKIMLGHKSLNTTQIYARLSIERMRKILEKTNNNLSPKQVPIYKSNVNVMNLLKSF